MRLAKLIYSCQMFGSRATGPSEIHIYMSCCYQGDLNLTLTAKFHIEKGNLHHPDAYAS